MPQKPASHAEELPDEALYHVPSWTLLFFSGVFLRPVASHVSFPPCVFVGALARKLALILRKSSIEWFYRNLPKAGRFFAGIAFVTFNNHILPRSRTPRVPSAEVPFFNQVSTVLSVLMVPSHNMLPLAIYPSGPPEKGPKNILQGHL
jgi:hypothetical protein